jgi:LmbE family N-acetylglucosaminyl deacetylase
VAGLSDGRLSDAPFDALVDRIAGILAEERPDVVATFGPDGIFGHPDHITIGAATDAAFLRLAADGGPAGAGPAPSGGRGFRRLCHGVIPESVFNRWNDQRAAMNLFVFDPTQTYHMRGVPDDQIGITIDTRPVSDRIVAGLSEHRSQHHVIIDDPHDVERWKRIVTREWWAVAWPERPAGAPMLTDLFDGLD